MKRLLTLLYIGMFFALATAQNVTLTFADTPLPKALRQIDNVQGDYTINFVYEKLERFRVTKEISNLSVPEAVALLCEGLPVKVKTKRKDIFVNAKLENVDFFTLSGRVIDDFTGVGLTEATVWLMDADSVVLDSAYVYDGNYKDAWGDFSFPKVARSKSLRSCIIKVTCPKYRTNYTAHSLRAVGKSAEFSLPEIYMRRKNTFTDRSLDDVEVTATKVMMFHRGDTLVYNADAFNVADGSMLDALIRQMPGVELTRDGEIFVDGKKIDNLLLNGKDFFRGKKRLMLENLPYYTVKEIKIYDKMTDKAVALQDAMARRDFVMDVNLKKEFSKGYMANVEAGAGTEDAYLLRLFGLRFTDVSRFAVVGGANNLNMANYSSHGHVYGDEPREGRIDNKVLTAEWMTEHKRSKNVMTVELKRRKTEQGADELQETFHNAASTFSATQSSRIGKDIGATLTNKYTLKLPFWMESSTHLRINDTRDDSDERYLESATDTRQQSLAMLDSLFTDGIAINDPSMLSARRRWMQSKAKVYGASQEFNFSKKLYSSDIIDITAGADFNKSSNDTERFDRYLAWKTNVVNASGISPAENDIMENIVRPNTHVGAAADVSYKISRLLYNTDLRFFATYRFNSDKDRETITDGVTFATDAMNSYNRHTTEHFCSMGANYFYYYCCPLNIFGKHEN